MGDISKHFNRSEFACKCGCGLNEINPELITVLEDVREYFKQPITINSGCRCLKHNTAVGGEPNSMHMQCIAADIVVKDVRPDRVYMYLDQKYPIKYGIGRYNSWTHIDVRAKRSRWRK